MGTGEWGIGGENYLPGLPWCLVYWVLQNPKKLLIFGFFLSTTDIFVYFKYKTQLSLSIIEVNTYQ